MNDKELADAVVALGIGTQVDYPKSSDGVGFYHTPGDDCGGSDGVYSKLFVRDWRVAGAMMEMRDICELESVFAWMAVDSLQADSESLPRAIVEALT